VGQPLPKTEQESGYNTSDVRRSQVGVLSHSMSGPLLGPMQPVKRKEDIDDEMKSFNYRGDKLKF